MDGEYHVICFYFVFGKHQEMLQALRDQGITRCLGGKLFFPDDPPEVKPKAKPGDPRTANCGIAFPWQGVMSCAT